MIITKINIPIIKLRKYLLIYDYYKDTHNIITKI